MKVICEHADKCSNAAACNHGVPHERWEGCIIGQCYHFRKSGENDCLPLLEGF